jgi:hypothetical protein
LPTNLFHSYSKASFLSHFYAETLIFLGNERFQRQKTLVFHCLPLPDRNHKPICRGSKLHRQRLKKVISISVIEKQKTLYLRSSEFTRHTAWPRRQPDRRTMPETMEKWQSGRLRRS